MKTNVYIADCMVGNGVFAARAFAPGDLIFVFRGRRIDRTDPVHRTPDAGYLLQTGPQTYIWPEPPGLYINHSCDPNAGIIDNRRVVALKPIEPHTELCFDYSTTMEEGDWTMACACGTAACRGVVGDFRDLPADVQDRYLHLGIVAGFLSRRYRNATSAPAGSRGFQE